MLYLIYLLIKKNKMNEDKKMFNTMLFVYISTLLIYLLGFIAIMYFVVRPLAMWIISK